MLLGQSAADPTVAPSLGLVPLPLDLYGLLNANDCYLCLGLISPDLPAIADQLWGLRWSDEMHDGNLRHAVVHVFAELQKLACTDAALAWVLGYVGHIVGDVAVHPVVKLANDARGGKVHREVEIVQDSLIFHEQTGADLTSAPYLETLKNCRLDLTTYNQVLQAWSAGLKTAYPGFDGSCPDWYGTYLAGVHVATTQSAAMASGLHFLLNTYVYRHVKDIDAKDRADFYDNVVVPNPPGKRGKFKPDVFDRGVRRLIELWRQMWTCWQTKTSIGALIPDWDLNSGKDIATGKLAFWP